MMLNSCFRVVQDLQEAEDIVQDIFMKIPEKLKSFKHHSSLGVWLKRVVINQSITILKKKKTISFDGDSIKNNGKTASNESFMIEVKEDDNEKKILVKKILDAIHQLPHGYKMVLSLYMIDNYDHKTIAQLLGVAESTVRSQYIRGKKKLHEILKNTL